MEFGLAANGISGIETALGLLIAGVDAGRLPLLRAIEAMTLGASRVLGDRIGPGSGLVEGEQATLVVAVAAVAGVQPPVAQPERGFLGRVEVPREHGVAAHQG